MTRGGVDLTMSPETPARSAPPGWERVVLIGFMGSGKTTVGRSLAARLGWTFVDLDDEVEATTGAKIADLFRTLGEAEFRRLEAEAGERVLDRPRTVVAPGGGWSLAPGRLESLPEGTLTVWLKVTPETAVRRAMRHARVRPLLAGPDPLGTARALLAERERIYAKARLTVDSEGASPAALAEEIVHRMESLR